MGAGQEREAHVEAFRDVVLGRAQPDLLEAAVQIAAPEYPELRLSSIQGQLDAWARAARARGQTIHDVPRTPALLASVCHVLFREVGLRGNRDDYGDPRNSFLNEVVDRRLGLPISLSVLFLEVAARVGLTAHGVAFPGHFLARVEDPAAPGSFVVVDSFGGGSILGVADLSELLAKVAGKGAGLVPSLLAPAPVLGILVRMLRNLKATYTDRDDWSRAILAQERILVLTPDEPGEIRDHGLLLARVDEPGSAVRQLERYLALSPTASDAADIRRTVSALRQHGFNVQ
ncbi:MAG: transglutaminase-like domain-containing protein [Myxococcota bacterium]